MQHKIGLITVLSGFSGAGKGTIMKHLLTEYPDKYHLSISATTRKPRTGEVDGREYFFKTKEEFKKMITEDAFLEYASFNDNYYGTPKKYVEDLANAGNDVILEIEMQGALNVKKIFPEALLLFVTPPDAASLKKRLVGRGTESKEEIENRLAISYEESSLMDKYDYLIVNDDINESVKLVHDIIECEHYRVSRNAENIKSVQNDLIIYKR